MTESDEEYYLRRHELESELAETSPDRSARFIHAALAERYRQRAQSGDGETAVIAHYRRT